MYQAIGDLQVTGTSSHRTTSAPAPAAPAHAHAPAAPTPDDGIVKDLAGPAAEGAYDIVIRLPHGNGNGGRVKALFKKTATVANVVNFVQNSSVCPVHPLSLPFTLLYLFVSGREPPPLATLAPAALVLACCC